MYGENLLPAATHPGALFLHLAVPFATGLSAAGIFTDAVPVRQRGAGCGRRQLMFLTFTGSTSQSPHNLFNAALAGLLGFGSGHLAYVFFAYGVCQTVEFLAHTARL
jgi:hypothetical protein